MKIDRSNFALLLMADSNNTYEGTFNVVYREKMFNREVEINQSEKVILYF